MTQKPFRFGVVTASAPTGDDWLTRARRVEALGYSTLLMPDVLRYTLAPLPALAMAAAVTRTLRLGTYVLANDLRHPALLARDAGSLDVLSGGRLELGIGAGRPGAEADNAMLGLSFDSGGVRLARLAESLGIIKRLLAGETVTASGTYYTTTSAQILPRPIQQPRPPILIAATGRRMLELAAREADIVAFGIAPDAPEATVAEMVGWLREAAGARFDEIELNLNLMAVGDQVPSYVARQLGLSAEKLRSANSVVAIGGSVEEMCTQLVERRARLGISYYLISDELMEGLAPVVERLSGT
jgi:probable F420-dependent oxidoreductase